MRKAAVIFISCLFVFLLSSVPCTAQQTVTAARVDAPPVIDGSGSDAAWDAAQSVITHDDVANIDMTLKAVYTGKEVFFLVSFPDADESRAHKNWTWDREQDIYVQGPEREDVFVFKWNMSPERKDLSVYADAPYVADIWFWKACRTDPSGFADDKVQRLTAEQSPRTREIKNASGNTMYLQRIGDDGTPAYDNTLFVEYQGDSLPRFAAQAPSGSRADVRAKGLWHDGRWTIEFGRLLDTGNADDVQFDVNKSFLFGVSRYEMAARPPEPYATQPLYGTGDVSEELYLSFAAQAQAPDDSLNTQQER